MEGLLQPWHATLIVGGSTIAVSIVMYVIGRLHQSSRYERIVDTRLVKLESQLEQMEEQRMEDRRAMHDEITRLTQTSEKVIHMCGKLIEQNTVLIAQIRAERNHR